MEPCESAIIETMSAEHFCGVISLDSWPWFGSMNKSFSLDQPRLCVGSFRADLGASAADVFPILKLFTLSLLLVPYYAGDDWRPYRIDQTSQVAKSNYASVKTMARDHACVPFVFLVAMLAGD